MTKIMAFADDGRRTQSTQIVQKTPNASLPSLVFLLFLRCFSSSPSHCPFVLLLFLFPPFLLIRSVSACFPGAPGSGCCSAPSCAASVPRCSPSSMAASHLSSYSHMAPPPPSPHYGYGHDEEQLYHHHHHGGGHGEDGYGAYDKHNYEGGYGGANGYGEKKYGGGGYDSTEKYDHNGYGGEEYGGRGNDKGYGDRGEYGNKEYGEKGYDKGGYGGERYGGGAYGGGAYGGGAYGGGAYGGPAFPPPAIYPQNPISSSYVFVPPPSAYPPNYNNFYPNAVVPTSTSLSYPLNAQLSPATPIQYPTVPLPSYQQSSSSLPVYVQQQSLYGSPSPPYNADLYQPNVIMPQQNTVEQPPQFISSSASAEFLPPPFPYSAVSPPLNSGPFAMTFAEPPGVLPISQSPAGGYAKAKVKSTKVLSTLLGKVISNKHKDKLGKESSRKSE